jgi:hypothetical protein
LWRWFDHMKITQTKTRTEVTTFKCASCGVRKAPGEAFNLTVACCSDSCFEKAFDLFVECMLESVQGAPFKKYKDELAKSLRQEVIDNPVPLY